MNKFALQGRTPLLAVATLIAAAFAAAAVAQTSDADGDTAYVPFVVNVDATVRAVFDSGDAAADAVAPVQISVTADVETIMRLPLKQTTIVRHITPIQTAAHAVISGRNGKITVNLPAQSYKNAEIALYSVNGKRIMRGKASAASAANNISRANVATGAYVLSIKGTDGRSAVSRLTHNGGDLNINVSFGGVGGSVGENMPTASAERLAKKAAAGDWTITVSAAGRVDSAYTLRPVAGVNTTQNITLRPAAGGGGDGDGSSYASVVIGGKKWMAKNLNVQTTNSWCCENSPDSCAKYGRLYTWNAAKTACPAGWHLPSRDEWDHLAESAGGTKSSNYDTYHDWLNAGKALKSTSGWYNNGNGTDMYGFSALPGGYYYGISFYDAGEYGYWWTAMEYSSSGAYYRSMNHDNDIMDEYSLDKSGGFSVRCVAD